MLINRETSPSAIAPAAGASGIQTLAWTPGPGARRLWLGAHNLVPAARSLGWGGRLGGVGRAADTDAQRASEELGWRLATMHGVLSPLHDEEGIGRGAEQDLLSTHSTAHAATFAGRRSGGAAGMGAAWTEHARGVVETPAWRIDDGDGDRMKGRPA